MRISASWLEQFVALPPLDELAHIFEMAGIGVEERDGEIFTLEVTSNRGDWLSAIGLAREIGAMTNKSMRAPHREIEGESANVQISIENPEDCTRYVARVIENVTVGESPGWLQQRLTECGIRSINNIVDITNLVMLETGQPLHAFDAGKLRGGIEVRRAREDEILTTLDDVERKLSPEVLVIADGEKAIALAGLMGGTDTEVSENTHTILLESAHFASSRVRRGARFVGLSSEASRRYERWVDPNGARRASDRACQLFHEICGARIGGIVDKYVAPSAPAEVALRVGRCQSVLGLKIPADAMQKCLERLGFEVRRDEETLHARIPTFRRDIAREVDLIEEVARIHGYDHIPTTLPRTVNASPGRNLSQRLEEKAKDALLRCGLSEIVTYSMQNSGAVARAGLPLENVVRLRNPLSEDYTQMRTSLLPSLLEVLQKNARNGARVFELGKVYLPRDEQAQPDECRRLGFALMDETAPAPQWGAKAAPLDFYFLKGIVETLLGELGAPQLRWRPTQQAPFHPGRCAALSLDGQDVGVAGEVHPEIAARWDLPARAFLAHLDFDAIVRHLNLLKSYQPLPRFPGIDRDLALVLPENIAAADVEETLRAAGGALLRRVCAFDVYTGAPIPAGHKSLTLSLSFRADERTLTDAEAEAALQAARDAAQSAFGASIRA